MIPRDEQFDVFISGSVLVEVWRGEHISTAQQFGEDWDGPVHSALHPAVFHPPTVATAAPEHVSCPTDSTARTRVACAATDPRPLLVIACLLGVLLTALGEACGWW